MNNELEYNYLVNQLNSNNTIRSVMQNEVTTLLNLAHSKRKVLHQLDTMDAQIQQRIDALGHTNKTIVTYE